MIGSAVTELIAEGVAAMRLEGTVADLVEAIHAHPTLSEGVHEALDGGLQGRPVRGTGGADVHASLGFNFKLTNLQAAVGLGQLEKLAARLERIRRTYCIYRDELAGTNGIRILPFKIEAGEQPQWIDALAKRRDQLDEFLARNGVGCRRFWFPLHTQKPYLREDTDYPNSTRLGKEAIWLPSAFQMTDDDVRSVCRLISNFYCQ